MRGLPRRRARHSRGLCFGMVDFFRIVYRAWGARRTARAGGSRQRRGARKAGRSFSRTPGPPQRAETHARNRPAGTQGTPPAARVCGGLRRSFKARRGARPAPEKAKAAQALASTAAPRHAPRTAGSGTTARNGSTCRRAPRRGTHRERREAAQRRGTDALASARPGESPAADLGGWGGRSPPRGSIPRGYFKTGLGGTHFQLSGLVSIPAPSDGGIQQERPPRPPAKKPARARSCCSPPRAPPPLGAHDDDPERRTHRWREGDRLAGGGDPST